MVRRNINNKQAKLGIEVYGENIPKDHISRFIVDFVEENYKILNIEEKEKPGRNPFPIVSMLKLLIYSKIEHVESAKYISDMAKYHEIYKFVSDDIKPSERSIQRYRDKYGSYFEVLLKMTLKKAYDNGFTEFNHVAIDGTIKKACNSNNNIITEKETLILEKYFKGIQIDEESLKKLNKPAKKILENKKINTSKKLELIYDIKTQLTLTGQKKIPVNDIEARFMKGKKGNFLVAYNVQSAVYYDTKLICAINVTQNPTDHYELPEIADKAIKNMNKKPKHISADSIYLNQISLSYLANNNIDGLIPTRKQSKQRIARLNSNPFHKDHFGYDFEKDAFLCPNNKYLYFYKEYVEHNGDSNKYDKIKRLYNNYSACKNCECRSKCISGSQTHKTITEYGSSMKKSMEEKMETGEYQDEYAKRSSVEGPYGVLKTQFNIEKEVVVGMVKTEERINLDALAYNIKRLYNITHDKSNSNEDLTDFCESTAISHQLKLEVTIF